MVLRVIEPYTVEAVSSMMPEGTIICDGRLEKHDDEIIEIEHSRVRVRYSHTGRSFRGSLCRRSLGFAHGETGKRGDIVTSIEPNRAGNDFFRGR